MMTQRINGTAMRYAKYLGSAPIYQTDDDGNVEYYTDAEGNRYAMDTGQYRDSYGKDGEMLANISMGGGDAEPVEYGLSVSDYQAVLVTEKNAYPIAEGDYIFVDTPIEYLYNGEEIECTLDNGETIQTRIVNVEQADYQIVKKADSLNMTRYVLKAVNK